jgi:hypothetical protein
LGVVLGGSRLQLLLLIVREDAEANERARRDDPPVARLLEVVDLLDVIGSRGEGLVVDKGGVLVVGVNVLFGRALERLVDDAREDARCFARAHKGGRAALLGDRRRSEDIGGDRSMRR